MRAVEREHSKFRSHRDWKRNLTFVHLHFLGFPWPEFSWQSLINCKGAGKQPISVSRNTNTGEQQLPMPQGPCEDP